MNVSLFLVALLSQQPASQPASQPSLRPGGTADDLTAGVTWIYEVDEQVLRVQESWQIHNTSGKLVDKEHVVIRMPENTRRLNVDEDAPGFEGNEASTEIRATQAIGSGTKQFGNAHMIDFDGSTAVVRRTMPVRTVGARLIIEDIDGVEITSNVENNVRLRELNGLNFRILEFVPMQAGGTLEVRFSGLPSHVLWPRQVAVLASLLVIAWMIYTLRKPEDGEGVEATMGPLSAKARRDQIVKAIEILQRDKAEEKIKPKRYERRYKELMAELADVLKEIEGSAKGG